jgi:hypothetical protein
MKTITIRCNNYLANWIVSNCQSRQITISEFVRDLLYKKMSEGKIDFVELSNRKFGQPAIASSRTEIGYIIFAAKLLEGFVQFTHPEGSKLRRVAFDQAEELLEQLNLNNSKNKQHRFNISLDSKLYFWLRKEADTCKVMISKFIRKILEYDYSRDQKYIANQRTELHNLQINHQIFSCKLLEKFIQSNVENSAEIISTAKNITQQLLQSLNSEQNQPVN